MIPLKLKRFFHPVILLTLLIIGLYWQFFLQGKIPVPADTLVGAYYPWLDYKWGYTVGVPIKNAPISDIFSQIFLWKYLGVDMLKSGDWPLWNPYSLSGTPLLANYQSSPFFPFNIFLLLPSYKGWGIFIFLQTLLAAVGMYLLLTKIISNSWAKIAGSLVFALSGLMSTYVEFGIAVWATALLPWIFYFLISYFEFFKIRYLFFISLAFASLYLAGHAQLTIYSTVLFFIFLIKNVWGKWGLLKQRGIQISVFWLLGAGLASMQLLPSFDIVNDSIRVSEAYLKNVHFGLSPIYEVIRLINADFFGNPATVNHWDTQSYHELSSFLGTLTLPMIIPLLLKRFRNKEVKFWGLVFLVSLLMYFQNSISEFIYGLSLPMLTYSAASRILFLTSFSGAVLMGIAFEKYFKEDSYRVWVRKVALILLGILSGIVLGILVAKKFLIPLNSDGDISVFSRNLSISIKNIILPIGILTFLCALSFFKKQKNIIACLLVAALFFDLGRYFLKYNPFVPSRLVFPTTPAIEFLQKQDGLFRVARADPEMMPPNTWIPYGIYSIEGYDPISLHSYASYFNRLNGTPFEGKPSRFIEVSKYPSVFLNSLNAKYLLAIKRDDEPGKEKTIFNEKLLNSDYKPVFEDKKAVIFLNPNASERVYFPEKLTAVSRSEDLISRLNDPGFNPQKEAIILGDKTTTGTNATGSAAIIVYKPNKMVIKTKMESPGFLVVAESFQEGWELFINHKREKIYQTNGALRGIFVPSGENELILNYWPKAFDLGLKASLTSLFVFVLINLYALIKKQW